MAIEDDSSRLELFDTDDFGVESTFGGNTIKGIFENGYTEIEGANIGLESLAPSYTCRTSDVSSAKHGDTLTIDGVAYSIVGVQPDGQGITMLTLEAP